MLTLEQVKSRMQQMGAQIGLEPDSQRYPLFSKTAEVWGEDGSIYIDAQGYHYVEMERGQENEHRVSKHLNEILYYVFEHITSSMASDYELRHRQKGKDFRRLMWKKQLELLGQLDERFVQVRRKEIAEYQKISPLVDE